MTAYLAVTTAIFTFMFIIWSRRSWIDVFLKVAFFGMAGWSGFLLFEALGYILKG